MDNFMDKLAQRLTAQEMIKANSAADAAELERLQKQLEQYDACLQEMRKLSLNNVETTDKIHNLIDESMEKIQQVQPEPDQAERIRNQLATLQSQVQSQLTSQQEQMQGQFNALQEKLQDQLTTLQEQTGEQIVQLRQAAAGSEQLDALKDAVNDFVHKENVKVYRNVQAVVVEEGSKQAKALEEGSSKIGKKQKGLMVMAVLTFVAVLADIAVNLLIHFGIF